jgi:2-polyprenyl-3-methyl-5-hydroxy-6-metoxy-1,4-benzoquinol methylase
MDKAEVSDERCPICGNAVLRQAQLTEAQETARQNVPDNIPYKVCTRCGLWVQFPPPPFQYEADDDKSRKEGILEESGHFSWLADLLMKSYNPSAVLDIGSSYPLLLSLLRDRGVPSIMGVDGSPHASDYGKELDVPVVQAEFLEHDFGPRQFDLISMIHVIEHFCSPMYAILKMKALLKPNGVIFLRTPLNDTTGLTRWHLTEYHFQVHPIIFSQRALKMLCELSGLQLIHEAVGNGIGHGDYAFKAR